MLQTQQADTEATEDATGNTVEYHGTGRIIKVPSHTVGKQRVKRMRQDGTGGERCCQHDELLD
jgi:hypothetical protein